VYGHGARNGGAESRAMVAKCCEILRHVWSVAGVDADAGKLADVELEGVAVQGYVLQRALCKSCLSSRRVFNEGGGWVLEHKPEMRKQKRGGSSG
jgi:hypothetical protein